jgi:hypothetical protein
MIASVYVHSEKQFDVRVVHVHIMTCCQREDHSPGNMAGQWAIGFQRSTLYLSEAVGYHASYVPLYLSKHVLLISCKYRRRRTRLWLLVKATGTCGSSVWTLPLLHRWDRFSHGGWRQDVTSMSQVPNRRSWSGTQLMETVTTLTVAGMSSASHTPCSPTW